MDADVKSQLRQTLLEEQGHLCAYCMKKLDKNEDVKIEHFEARTPDNELQYRNLLAVCKGNEGQRPELQTCDTRKGNAVLRISPLNQQHMQTIYYSNNGKIHSSNPEMDDDINSVLNLNCPQGALVKARERALKTLQKGIEKELRNKTDRTAKIRYFQTLQRKFNAANTYQTEYVGIVRWYIDKKLSQLNN